MYPFGSNGLKSFSAKIMTIINRIIVLFDDA